MPDWENPPLICYGDDGPCFVRLCPNCARFMKWPHKIRWQENFNGMCEFQKIECGRCGSVTPEHVGWKGDFV